MDLKHVRSFPERISGIACIQTMFFMVFCILSLPIQAATESLKLKASDGASEDEYGYAVAIDGNRFIVGALEDDDKGSHSGSAYLYELDTHGVWVENKLTASDGAFNNFYGSAVSIDGDRAIVGAWRDDDDVRGFNAGSAYVYERDSNGNWLETKLLASDGTARARFGGSVSIQGDRAIVGAYTHSGFYTQSGSAYVYERDANGNWIETKLVASDAAAGARFGVSVAIDGDRAVVGAYGDDASGSVYVYERDTSGNWIETKLLASDGAQHDLFGYSVSIDGDRILVGAAQDDDNGNLSGSAYIYEPDTNSNWIETKLSASDGTANDVFGYAVSIKGDRAIVGARLDDDNGDFSGSAYVYERRGDGSWVESKLLASDPARNDVFGFSVSIDGGRAIVGASLDDDNGIDSGSVYVFELEPQITAPVAKSSLSGTDGTQTFEWAPHLAEVTEWWLYVGSSPGGLNYHSSGSLSASTLSTTVSGLPQDASTVHTTLWYRIQGDDTWYFSDETYTASGYKPTISLPATGSTLAGATQTFTWQGNGASVSLYWLDVGSDLGASDYFRSGDVGTGTSVIATGLPSDGVSTVYVRLWYRVVSSTTWFYVDAIYTAGTTGVTTPAIVSPAPPGPFTNTSGSEALSWTDNGTSASEYWLFAGSAPGTKNFFDSGSLSTALSTTLSGLPVNGTSVWIRLWYRNGGSWLHIDEEYTAAGSGPTITSSNGTGILTTPDDTFSWTDPNGSVTAWWLYLGSSAGASDHENSGNLGGANSYTTTNSNLPGGSAFVHARLWYQEGVSGAWQFIDKVFSSAP